MKRRRVLLGVGGWMAISLCGCVGTDSGTATGIDSRTPSETTTDAGTETASRPLEYDCEDAHRPPSPAPDETPPGDDSRYRYPQRPASLSDEQAVLSYAEAYERAYRLNDWYAQSGDDLVSATLSVTDTWTYEAPAGAAIARLKYFYGHEVVSDGKHVVTDSRTIYAAYYVDDAVVLRATQRGHRDDEAALVPDPLEEGRPVQCF